MFASASLSIAAADPCICYFFLVYYVHAQGTSHLHLCCIDALSHSMWLAMFLASLQTDLLNWTHLAVGAL
jgi:hypothetical protein